MSDHTASYEPRALAWATEVQHPPIAQTRTNKPDGVSCCRLGWAEQRTDSGVHLRREESQLVMRSRRIELAVVKPSVDTCQTSPTRARPVPTWAALDAEVIAEL